MNAGNMNINFNLEELLSPESLRKAEQGAKEAKLPLPIYIVRAYDHHVSQVPDNPPKTKIVRSKPETKTEAGDAGQKKLLAEVKEHFLNYGKPIFPEEMTHETKKQYTTWIAAAKDAEEDPANEVFDALDLSTRAHNLVTKYFTSIEGLREMPHEELLKLDGMGEKSAEEIRDSLIEHDGSTVSDDGPEEGLDPVDYRNQIIDLKDSEDSDAIAKAGSIYRQAWGIDPDDKESVQDVFSELREVYDKEDPSTINDALGVIYDYLPMTSDESSAILEQGRELGEPETDTRQRATAAFGKEFNQLTIREARALSEEIKSEVGDRVQVDEDFDF